ncbi:Gfo/Idh/MocA family oxidoreductase [Halomicrobium sp. LC1Hm]|uniref:Gfo/Idh/MocA family oxidoreductase n=1 Tax=Halomicrobium sp. LC1Hm TaxID=2610902 RepID=UPI001885B7FD|nr:Gfo/Idh/MocA family oxidoreductase [Halomicrobium sp. LC1Hm]
MPGSSRGSSTRRPSNAFVTGVMNPTVNKAEAVADACREAGSGDPIATGDVRELVAHEDVDAVWVTSPSHTRVETVAAIVEEVQQGGADLVDYVTEPARGEFTAGPAGVER